MSGRALWAVAKLIDFTVDEIDEVTAAVYAVLDARADTAAAAAVTR